MRTLRRWAMRVRGMFGRGRAEQEFAAELESHLAMHTEDGIRAGLSEQEARRQARIKLGGIGENRELYFEQRGLPLLENLARDAAYSLRLLRANPSFTAVAVLSLALGIGANTAMFSLVNAAMLRPPPYPDADRLLHTVRDVNMPELESLGHTRHAFSDVAGWQSGAERRIEFQGKQEWVTTARVTPGFFRTLRVPLGQGEEFAPNASEQTAILSHALWHRMSGGFGDAAGQVVSIDGQQYTVVGVTAERLWLPEKADVFVPLRPSGTAGDLGLNTQVIARLTQVAP
ncbi:MAG: ABC transporter permease, partial [Bryobacterales bacterium]|nr:ABC transporter permease [Bryobacterales bacterium]